MFGFPWDCAQPEPFDRINLLYLLPFTWCNYKDEFRNGGILSVKAVWWFFVKDWPTHWHTLNISVSQQKQEERNQNVSYLQDKPSCCHLWLQIPPPGKNANVRHWRDSPFTANASKRGYGIWKSLEKKTVYVCVGHLKWLRISLVVHYNSEQCDRKHIHNLKSPSEEHLSFIFIFQCVLLSRIMHVGWNIIGEIMGVQI